MFKIFNFCNIFAYKPIQGSKRVKASGAEKGSRGERKSGQGYKGRLRSPSGSKGPLQGAEQWAGLGQRRVKTKDGNFE